MTTIDMTDRAIKRFKLNGTVVDPAEFARTRSLHEQRLMHIMRESGYARILDLSTMVSGQYLSPERYDYCITMQGSFVGKRRVEKIEGILDGKIIWKPIPIQPEK